jgi:hypothetical protein
VTVSLSSDTGRINADLTVGTDLTKVQELAANGGMCANGVALHGHGFILEPAQAKILRASGREVIKPYLGGKDLLGVARELYLIDFSFMELDQARAANPAAFQWVIDRVKPERDQNNREALRDRWWRFAWERPGLMTALKGLPRYIATTETAKHRIFRVFRRIRGSNARLTAA